MWSVRGFTFFKLGKWNSKQKQYPRCESGKSGIKGLVITSYIVAIILYFYQKVAYLHTFDFIQQIKLSGWWISLSGDEIFVLIFVISPNIFLTLLAPSENFHLKYMFQFIKFTKSFFSLIAFLSKNSHPDVQLMFKDSSLGIRKVNPVILILL